MEAKARTQEAATKYPPVSFGIGVDQATGVSNAVLRIGNDFIHAPIELLGLFKMFTAAPEMLSALKADASHVHTAFECGGGWASCPVEKLKCAAIANAEGK